MKIIRYSSTAFTPQKQTHHIKKFESKRMKRENI